MSLNVSKKITKCTVCGKSGHTRIHYLDMCGVFSWDSRKWDCQQTPAKKQITTKKGKRAANSVQ